MGWYLGYTVVYFSIMFAIGFYYFTKVKTSDEYLVAGWNMGFWSIVGTIISTFCGAAVFIGWVGMGFTVGISGFFKFALPAILVSILLIVLFSKPLRRQRLYTLSDLFSERFGNRVGIIPSILSAIIYAIPTTALQIVGMSTVFKIAFGLEFKVGILLSFALILGFTILGGLTATIVTDAIQSVIVICGIVILFVASIVKGGGLAEILSHVKPEYISPAGPDGLSEVLLFALSVGPFYLVWESTWQRIFASKTEQVAQRAGVTGFMITGIITILPFSIGIAAREFAPLDMRPDLLFSYITVELLPPAIGGIILVGLLSALMTGADSFILQGSSSLTKSLYHRLMNPKASEKNLMFVSRLSVVIVSVLALIIAFNLTDIISMYQWALRLSATVLVIPFLATMFWRRATSIGTLSSMMAALIATLSWPYLDLSIDHSAFGFLASLLTLVTVSLMTKHANTEQVRAVYWEDLDSAIAEVQEDQDYNDKKSISV